MADAPPQPEPARLCLNMIVRNEMANLPRCLDAIAPHIACWVIGDTGSSDGTQDYIRAYFAARSIPGELHAFPFVNFEQARNAALDHAYASPLPYDYLLLADADMELVVDDPTFRARLDAPGYQLLQRAGESRLLYWNTRLVRRDTPARARYHGVTHEYLDLAGDPQKLPGVWFKDHVSGANRTHKIERDINLLQAALQADPADRRTWYYLAQSYRDAGRMRDAADTYAKRAAMGGWEEEAWNARLHEARCLRALGDDAGFLRAAQAAFDQRPWRAEPLYELAHHHRERGNHAAAVQYAERGLAIPRPHQDILFVEDYVYSAGLLEELAIAAFYTNDPDHKARGHAACEQLALSRTVQPDTRDLARANLFFYAEPLRAIAPSFSAQRIAFDPPEGWRALNPSIARHGDHIVAIQRTVNYVLREDGHYVTADGAPIATRNYLLRLSDALEVESAAEILPPADWPPPRYDLVRGFEDARLFAWRDALWCTATVRDQTPEGWCEQVLARIDDPTSTTCRLTDWRMLRPDGERRHEKNWMPLVDGDALRFIYLCDPTRLVDDTARTLTETTPPIAADAFKGSSQAIAFDGGWLTLIHEVTQHGTSRAYQHRFVWFDATATLRKISRRFYLQQQGVEFVAGLAWHPDGRRLLMSYGVQDCETWSATVDTEEVRATLSDLQTLLLQSDERHLTNDVSAHATGCQKHRQLEPGTKTIGLCMIVKNEARVIRRCLDSVRPLLDYVLIEDTGSTDGTQDIIRTWLKETGKPGEVFDEPWQNFAHNRSIALAKLRDNSAIDYALIMDADDVMEYEPGFDLAHFKETLSADHYHVAIRLGGTKYSRPQICSNRKAYRYRGVLHEFLEGPEPALTTDTAHGLLILAGVEGARSNDPEKYRRDAATLERALQNETDEFMRSRYTFYLAQSYRDSGDTEKALEYYLRRAELGFWDDEIYISLRRAAELQASTHRPAEKVLATYRQATEIRPCRIEAIHGASHFCRMNERYEQGFQLAKIGLPLTEAPPPPGLFIEPWIYEYGLLDEYAVNAYWAGHYQECLHSCERLLSQGKIPSSMHGRVKKNADFARQKLREAHTVAQTTLATRSTDAERLATVVVIRPAGYDHWAAYHEFSETVAHGLDQLGYKTSITSDVTAIRGRAIVIGAHVMPREEASALPDHAIIYNTENTMWIERSGDIYLSILRRFEVWDYSQDNARRLTEMLGKPVRFVKLGYVRQLTRIKSPSDQDIDVLFCGSLNARRLRILDGLQKSGLSVRKVFGVYGSERDKLVARAKVVLNMHFYEAGAFEVVRVSYMLANKKAVVTEANSGETIDEDLSGAVLAVPYDELIVACQNLVHDEPRRHALEKAGFVAFVARNESHILRAAMLDELSQPRTTPDCNYQSEESYMESEAPDLVSSVLRMRNKYLRLLEASLTGSLHGDPPIDPWSGAAFDPTKRMLGRDWPSLAQTMIGTVRMRNLRHLCETAIINEISGDFIETGVWRGGACIYMKGILDAYGDHHRRVFVADSFKGLPPPNPAQFSADAGDTHHTHGQLAVSKEDVEENFRKYGLLDDRVVFLQGWFKDTLPTAPIERLSILRLDGDMYESTIQALDSLYHKISYGGFVIVDDYFLKPCAAAVDEFRSRHGITSPLLPIDGLAVWWTVDHQWKILPKS